VSIRSKFFNFNDLGFAEIISNAEITPMLRSPETILSKDSEFLISTLEPMKLNDFLILI
jgi:hypothetical protein